MRDPKLLRFILAFSVALPQQAQQKKEETVTFTSSSTLVIVNCFVRDKSGNPVEGLKKEDFRLLEDGKPQNIAVFEYQKLEDPIAGPAAKPALLASVAKPATAKSSGPKAPAAITPSKSGELRYRDRRLIVVLFDMSSLSPQDQTRAQKAALKFLQEKMTPSDVIAILAFTSDLKVLQDFTDDRYRLAREVKALSIWGGSALAGEDDTADANTGGDPQAAFTVDEKHFKIF